MCTRLHFDRAGLLAVARRRQAVVVGGSQAGMLAARVLSVHFESVTLLERDRFTATPAARKGLPQGRHLHVLLERGHGAMERLLPDLPGELVRAGTEPLDATRGIDGYNVLPLHITYFEYLEQTAGSRPTLGEFSESFDLGNGHAVVKFRGPWARPVARWTPALGEGNRERVEAAYANLVRKYGPERAELIGRTDRALLIFRNLVILDIMGIVVRSITPTSAGHTKVTQWSLASAGEDSDLRAQRLDSFIAFQGPGGLATPDDLEAFEACQAGLRAAAGVPWSDISRGMHRERRGLPSRADDELQMRAFWRQWQTLLSA